VWSRSAPRQARRELCPLSEDRREKRGEPGPALVRNHNVQHNARTNRRYWQEGEYAHELLNPLHNVAAERYTLRKGSAAVYGKRQFAMKKQHSLLRGGVMCGEVRRYMLTGMRLV